MSVANPPVFQMPPKNSREQLDRAAKAVAEEDAAGAKAMNDACGDEFNVPTTMAGAARIIARLRAERDKSHASALSAGRQYLEFQKTVIADCAAALTGTSIRSDSVIAGVANEIAGIRADRDKVHALHAEFSKSIREVLIDMKLTEIPGMAGYFSAATPMLRAAEAAATFICTTDRLVREAYLRRRGWKLSASNTWKAPGEKSYTVPYETAVIQAVKADCAPFAGLGTREWKGIEEKRQTALKANRIPVHVIHETFTPAETAVVSHTRPVQPIATWQERPDGAEIILMPRMEDGPES